MKELEKNKYKQKNELLEKQIEEIKMGSIQISKLCGEGEESMYLHFKLQNLIHKEKVH